MSAHDVGDIVTQAINSFQPTLPWRDVEITVHVPPDLPKLVCDRGAVVDALVNLLSNAYKYGGSNRKIDISAAVDDEQLRLAVRDNGVGIERREHKRIFLKFYRVDDKLTRKQDGSGLGLAIVQYVMRAHSGRVDVESAPGAGSTCTLVLPVKRPVTDRLLPDGPAALAAKGGT